MPHTSPGQLLKLSGVIYSTLFLLLTLTSQAGSLEEQLKLFNPDALQRAASDLNKAADPLQNLP